MHRISWFLLIAIAVGAGSASAAEPTGVIESADTLAQACRAMQRVSGSSTKKASADAVLCIGYMQAMQDLTVLTDENHQGLLGSCPAETTTLGELTQAFLDYARTHPARPGENAAVAVIRSFQIAYPCAVAGQALRTSEPSLDATSKK